MKRRRLKTSQVPPSPDFFAALLGSVNGRKGPGAVLGSGPPGPPGPRGVAPLMLSGGLDNALGNQTVFPLFHTSLMGKRSVAADSGK